jgi:hypothetical protein
MVRPLRWDAEKRMTPVGSTKERVLSLMFFLGRRTPFLSAGAKSVCRAPSIFTSTTAVYTGAKSVGTGAESVGTDLKLPGTAFVSVLPPIVPAPTAESRAAGWLNQRWNGMPTGHANDPLRQDPPSPAT